MSSSSSPYAPAARLLSEVWTKHKSLKTLAYSPKGELRCNKATYAQVCHVLESKQILDTLMDQVKQPIRNKALAYVLLYELMLGPNKAIRGGGALKRALTKQEGSLRKALVEIQEQIPSTNEAKHSFVSFPRYVRVNTLRASVKKVTRALLQNEHFQNNQVFCDVHVPNLLVLPSPLTKILHKDFDVVQSHQVVLQDKSSCFSSLCLVHGSSDSAFQFSGDVLDACAAPGNKTSHVAALLAENVQHGQEATKAKKNRKKGSTVYALDRSSTRFASLKRRMEQIIPSSGPSSDAVKVVCQHRDFLQTKPADYPNLGGILLDPSCSGSGIYTSPDRHGETQHGETNDENETEDAKKRLESLSNFQLTCLRHAMSFPQAERIVYSTCSLHDIENEGVVAQAIDDNDEWEIVAPACLQHWKRRGRAVNGLTQQQAQCLIRANQDDETNGFFVCYFERKTKNRSNGSVKISGDIAVVPPHGIELYNGQFQDSGKGKDAIADSKDKGRQEDKCKSTLREKQAAKPSNVENASLSVTKPAEEESSTKDKISKKRAKKIAWKKRQMEQKMQRMQTKKTKLENTES